MEKISINLLPPEFTAEQVKKAKFYKIQGIGVVAILVMVFLSSLTVALRILQSQNISEAQTILNEKEQQVLGLKGRQASLILLKNRLTAVSKYLGVSSKQASVYKFINDLLPPTFGINSLTVDKSGEILILAVVSDVITLDNFISTLISDESGQGKVSQLSIENLNRGRDGIYRVGLKIKP